MTTDTLTTSEVARLFKVHPQTVARWANNGQLPCWQAPSGRRRFSRSAVEAFLPPTTSQ